MRSIRVAVIAFVALAASCAAPVEEPETTDQVVTLAQTQEALSTPATKFTAKLEMRAVLGTDGITTIDLTTGNMFGPNDPHYIPGGTFAWAGVWVRNASTGVVRFAGSLAAGGIPGGGCIHIRVGGLGINDYIQVGALIQGATGGSSTKVAAVDTKVVGAPQPNLPFEGPAETENMTLH